MNKIESYIEAYKCLNPDKEIPSSLIPDDITSLSMDIYRETNANSDEINELLISYKKILDQQYNEYIETAGSWGSVNTKKQFGTNGKDWDKEKPRELILLEKYLS